ncbi:MAG: nucleoside phosphorylase [Spirochaetales bacterium]|nr:nucleoside phosphorylase [Spirochaetales bacterium]MCF7939937.1 nucleoside phosphorylase [Spirochaetales bacterium]
MLQPHIQCEKVNPYVLLPGDPRRVDRVASHLTDAKEKADNREFRTIEGSYQGMPVTVTSTGIGGASAAIALEELVQCGGKYFIRIGSAGAVQPHINIGDIVVAAGAVREDGASKMYIRNEYPAVASALLVTAIEQAAEQMQAVFHTGIVRSHDSFYIDEEQEQMAYWHKKGVLASDMETAALLVVGRLRNVEAASILNNVVLYKGDVKEGINEYVSVEDAAQKGEETEIRLGLEAFYTMYQK